MSTWVTTTNVAKEKWTGQTGNQLRSPLTPKTSKPTVKTGRALCAIITVSLLVEVKKKKLWQFLPRLYSIYDRL